MSYLWKCLHCDLFNYDDRNQCEACFNDKTLINKSVGPIFLKMGGDKEKSLLITQSDNQYIIPCNKEKFVIDLPPPYTFAHVDMDSFVTKLGITRSYRWRSNQYPYVLCHNGVIEAIGDNIWRLEEKIEIKIMNSINNKNEVIDADLFPSDSFRDIACKFCEYIPTDVLIQFKGKQYDIFTSPIQMEIAENDTVNVIKNKDKKWGGSLNMFIKTLTNNCISMDVNSNDTVWDVKHRIFKKEIDGYPLAQEQQMLIYAGKKLQNNMTLADYGIKKESTLHLVLNMRGS